MHVPMSPGGMRESRVCIRPLSDTSSSAPPKAPASRALSSAVGSGRPAGHRGARGIMGGRATAASQAGVGPPTECAARTGAGIRTAPTRPRTNPAMRAATCRDRSPDAEQRRRTAQLERALGRKTIEVEIAGELLRGWDVRHEALSDRWGERPGRGPLQRSLKPRQPDPEVASDGSHVHCLSVGRWARCPAFSCGPVAPRTQHPTRPCDRARETVLGRSRPVDHGHARNRKRLSRKPAGEREAGSTRRFR